MKVVVTLILALSMFGMQSAFARDDLVHVNIKQVLNSADGVKVLNPDVKLFFGEQTHATPAKTFGEVVTNKKTNAFAKSDEEACAWVFLSAIKALQQRAVKEGHNAVVGITSYYKKRSYSSEEKFECGAGTVIAGVALKGMIVSL
ncbi:hypothetical protein EZV61_10385 [Corallincola luteus]|uniref:Excinuclease ATPase subunit n=2 Tax=Corallincola TaxID=1775176 RepID=A0A368NRI6_9GAMM|nr:MULTISPECIES: hypothetical protein [Corallincola]RCU52776.1 hypothetical protein DU002_02100 [Corallincola holothuriorum]TCI03277.1 hypothetical protein EZV61_10385 [Corallincola luteus]